MRPRPATRAASYVVSCLAIVATRACDDRFSATALEWSAAFTKANCRSFPCGGESTTAAVGHRPACSEEQNRGRRPQRLGSQPRSRACWIPPAIHPRESPAAAGSAAIIRQAQESSRFALNTLSHFVAPRKNKTSQRCAETVEDLTSLWKSEEKAEKIPGT